MTLCCQYHSYIFLYDKYGAGRYVLHVYLHVRADCSLSPAPFFSWNTLWVYQTELHVVTFDCADVHLVIIYNIIGLRFAFVFMCVRGVFLFLFFTSDGDVLGI